MQRMYIFVVVVFLTINIQSINAQEVFKQKSSLKAQVKIRDTLFVVNKSEIQLLDQREIKKGPDGLDYSKTMPWITAMFIGLLTACANIYLGYKLRKSSERALREQLETATNNTIAQINVSRENNQRDFNKTVLSGNRQVWISEFRRVVSIILAMISSFVTKQGITDQQFQELKILLIQAELMLGAKADSLFVDELKNLEQFCYQQLLKLNSIDDLEPLILSLKEFSIKRLEAEWEKVKVGV